MSYILIADDDEIQRVYLKRLITSKFNYQVKEAKNGVEALAVIEEEKPDTVFLDVNMPKMSGLECLRNIRETFDNKRLPVIILTANHSTKTVKEFMELGIVDYVLKPFGLQNTYARLKKLLHGTISTI